MGNLGPVCLLLLSEGTSFEPLEFYAAQFKTSAVVKYLVI